MKRDVFLWVLFQGCVRDFTHFNEDCQRHACDVFVESSVLYDPIESSHVGDEYVSSADSGVLGRGYYQRSKHFHSHSPNRAVLNNN